VAIGLRLSPRERRNLLWGLFFTLPWIIGLLWLLLYPICSSLYYSFTQYNMVRPPKWVGLHNFQYMFTDRHYWRAVSNTMWFVIVAVPINIAVSFLLAELLNQKIFMRSFWRTVFYLPTIVPQMAAAMLWLWVFNPFGPINGTLARFGLSAIPFLSSPAWVKPSLTIVTTWICGGNIVLFLAALQDVPMQLREAARIDGANWWDEMLHITVPCVTPVILFTVINGMIWAFQFFTFAYTITGNGPGESSLFYAVMIYDTFVGTRMGLAAAMAWVLFLIVAVCTFVLFRTSARWVYYGGD